MTITQKEETKLQISVSPGKAKLAKLERTTGLDLHFYLKLPEESSLL